MKSEKHRRKAGVNVKNIKMGQRNLFDEFEVRGEWWLPGYPETKIPGVLYFTSQNISLELMGSWKEKESLIALFQEDSFEIILGQSSESEQFTLLKSVSYNQTLSFSGYSSVKYNVNSFVVGGHFENKEDLIFKACSIYTSNLSNWIARPAISTEEVFDDDFNLLKLKALYKKLDGFEYNVPVIDAVVKELKHLEYNENRYGNEINWRYTSGLSITSEDSKEIEWFNQRSIQLINFVSIFLGKGIYFEKIHFKGPKTEIAFLNGKVEQVEKNYMYFRKQYGIEIKKEFKPNDVIIHFRDIENDFENVLNAWFKKYDELKIIYDLYFSTLYNVIHVDSTFLNAVQMLEIYHRTRFTGKYFEENTLDQEIEKILTFSKENIDSKINERISQTIRNINHYSLNKRLKELMDVFEDNSLEVLIGSKKDVKKFLMQLVDTRNYLAHYDESSKPNLIKGIDERFYAIKRLQAIITLLLLKEIGLDEHLVLNKIKDSKHYSYSLGMAKKILRSNGSKTL